MQRADGGSGAPQGFTPRMVWAESGEVVGIMWGCVTVIWGKCKKMQKKCKKIQKLLHMSKKSSNFAADLGIVPTETI